jgi:antitoxin HicB
MYGYPLVVRPLSDQEGGGFLVEAPDLPGCIADGQTVEEAIHEAESVIESWIKTAKEFNDEIPRPSIAQQFSGQWRIKIPKSLHAALALHAKEEGVSLNMLAATLLAQGIGKELAISHKSDNMK